MTVELFGPARALAGAATVELALDGTVDLATFVRALAEAHPELVGDVVAPSRDRFIEPNYVLLDGRRAVGATTRFGADDRPCVFSLASGG